jgi:hypothetical protein
VLLLAFSEITARRIMSASPVCIGERASPVFEGAVYLRHALPRSYI